MTVLAPPYAGSAATHSLDARRALIFELASSSPCWCPSLIAYALDERLLNDINIWTKPIKFQLSLMVTMLTVLYLLPLLSAEWLTSRLVRWSALVISTSSAIEISYITLQSARGRGSHFYFATPLEQTMYSVMGRWRCLDCRRMFPDRASDPAFRAARQTDRFGHGGLDRTDARRAVDPCSPQARCPAELSPSSLAIGSAASAAMPMACRSLAGPQPGGDLRVPHFFATHIMQALPVLGLLADRLMPERANRLSWLARRCLLPSLQRPSSRRWPECPLSVEAGQRAAIKARVMV